jgi:hypothetical protein
MAGGATATPISLKAQGTASTGSTGGGLSLTYGATPTVGNLLVCCVATGGGGTLPTISSAGTWTTATSHASTNCNVVVFYKLAVAGEATPVTTSAVSSETQNGILFEFQAARAGPVGQLNDPFDPNTTGFGIGTSGSDSASQAQTNMDVGDLLVWCFEWHATTAATITTTPSLSFSTGTLTQVNNNGSSLKQHYNIGFASLTNFNSPQTNMTYTGSPDGTVIIQAGFRKGRSNGPWIVGQAVQAARF